MNITPYLSFDGRCEEAIKFYHKCLGGEINVIKGGDTPMAEKMPEWRDRVMHARITHAGGMLMGSDGRPGDAAKAQGFNVCVGVDSPEEAERLYKELGEGGTVTMAMEETFWAKRFGTVSDKFGTPWMINCEKPMR